MIASHPIVCNEVFRVAHATVINNKLAEIPASIIDNGIKMMWMVARAEVLETPLAWRTFELVRVRDGVDERVAQHHSHQHHCFLPRGSLVLII